MLADTARRTQTTRSSTRPMIGSSRYQSEWGSMSHRIETTRAEEENMSLRSAVGRTARAFEEALQDAEGKLKKPPGDGEASTFVGHGVMGRMRARNFYSGRSLTKENVSPFDEAISARVTVKP